ncbi:MAG: murein L,D-transpeptidase [Gemmatimonadales bacterium]
MWKRVATLGVLALALAGQAIPGAESATGAGGAAGRDRRTAPVPDSMPELIRALVSAGRLPGGRWAAFPDAQAAVDSLYRARGFAPLWLEGRVPTGSARMTVGVLRGARSRGLDPADYDADWLAAEPVGTDSAAAWYDAALTVAAIRYATDLWLGRADPRVLHPGLRFDPRPLDRAAWLVRLATDSRPDALLRGLEPVSAEYGRLLGALAVYRALAADSTLAPRLPGRGTFGPGAAYPGAARLRRLLTAVGDLPTAPAPRPEADTLLAPDLVSGLVRFQRRHGLTPDSVLGPITAARLNEPLADRVRDLELALERWRWLPRSADGPWLLVDLAAFEVQAFAAGFDPARIHRVIVGEAEEHETPEFTATATAVVFRPWWEVPASIMRLEIRPAALADSAYLVRQRMELWIGDQVVDPSRENRARIGFGVRVRQRPGPPNALGDVKLLLPNPYAVYLHDTPSKALFDLARRDFSHGCVRVDRAADLMRWLLEPLALDSAWVAAALADSVPTEVALPAPVPVVVWSRTATAPADGPVRFHPDLYGHDARLADALRQRSMRVR